MGTVEQANYMMNLSEQAFEDIFEENTEILFKKEQENNKWINADGTYKKNYIWKYASRSKQGTAGENIIKTALYFVLSSVYDSSISVDICNKGIGDFDIEVNIPQTNKTVKIEVKTATEDVSGNHQFNGLKKNIDYDYAVLLGITPDNFLFKIVSREELCDRMTTNMSKNVQGSYKYTLSQKQLVEFNPTNFYTELCNIGIIE